MSYKDKGIEEREVEFEIDPIFIGRWSPRAMSGEKIESKKLMKIFEAARWAPSCYNNQSWRFVYVEKDSERWDDFFEKLSDFNQEWAKNASALVVIISKTTFDHNNEYSKTHSFDVGAAWENMALQGSEMDLVVHGMAGFDYDKMEEMLGLSKGYEIEAMAAVGKHGKEEQLPEEMREKETPSDRKEISEIVNKEDFNFE